MDRHLHDLMMAQYATPAVSGEGLVSWDKGVKCVLPSVKLMGAATQGTLTGKNLFDPNAETSTSGSYIGFTQCFSLSRPFVVSISLKPGKELPSNASFGYIFRKTTDGSASADWLVKDGSLIATQSVVTDSDYAVELIGAYPQSALASFLDALDIQLELGSTATAYEPYCGGVPAPNPSYPIMPVCNDGVYRSTSPDGTWDGGQATAPELWAIPGTDIRDEWDAQTGHGIRRAKKIVLDGTEAWKYNKENEYKFCIYRSAYKPPLDATYGNAMCSHLDINYAYATNLSGGNAEKTGIALATRTGVLYLSLPLSLLDTPDLDGAKGYLAKQYADGTPVTLLATQEPEPFYHPPARLTQPNGPGQIIQVSGSVPECPIEADYLTHS